jgi:hypothetical protein
MKTKLVVALSGAILLQAATAIAAGIDMNDPNRALGREDDVRVDAQLTQSTVSPGSPIGVTYQIENLSANPIAIADRVSDASYDDETGMITVAIGAEVPPDGNQLHLTVIKPGEKKVLRGGATPSLNAAAVRAGMASAPRLVQVKVTILRDLAPFAPLLAQQQNGRIARLPDELFDKWFESTGTIMLNTLPVQYSPQRRLGDASDRGQAGGY